MRKDTFNLKSVFRALENYQSLFSVVIVEEGWNKRKKCLARQKNNVSCFLEAPIRAKVKIMNPSQGTDMNILAYMSQKSKCSQLPIRMEFQIVPSLNQANRGIRLQA